MSDADIRTLERRVATDPSRLPALERARLRAGHRPTKREQVRARVAKIMAGLDASRRERAARVRDWMGMYVSHDQLLERVAQEQVSAVIATWPLDWDKFTHWLALHRLHLGEQATTIPLMTRALREVGVSDPEVIARAALQDSRQILDMARRS